MKKKILFIFIMLLFFVSCNSPRQSQPVVETQTSVEYPVGYIAQSLSTDLYDTTELYALKEEFLDNFMRMHAQYSGTQVIMSFEFPEKWGIALVERLPEGRELYQIQSQNREWIYLVITSGYGTQRILDLLPVAVNLANQTENMLETEIWTTERELDGTFTVTKKYEWKRSLEKISQKEYEANPRDYFHTQTITDKYCINNSYHFEKINTEEEINYSAVIFYYKDEKPEEYEEVVPMLHAFCEDYEILFATVNCNFNQLELYDYKLNFITVLDLTPYIDFQEGFIFLKNGASAKTVPFGSYERLKIEVKRYFKIVEV
jgi:hypothetical protein